MAARFWVGGTGTWDASDTTHWATGSGLAGGASVPGSSDTATFDGSSGGGTVTVGAAYNPALQTLTMGAFTGTLDFATNDNNVTISTGGVSITGSGTRTLNMGDGTWTITSTGTVWNAATVTGLTFNANGSTIACNATTNVSRTFSGGGLTYNNLTIGANTGSGQFSIAAANTFATLTIGAPNFVMFASSVTTTVASLVIAGTSSAGVSLATIQAATISDATGTNALDWCAIRGIAFAGGATWTATNSLDCGGNSGITITPPASGGGGNSVFGGLGGVIA